MSANVILQSGYFGKYPGYRDFVQHGLDAARIENLRMWAGEVMDYGSAHLGDEWLEVYLHSPIWRYCFKGKYAGNRITIGAAMPSLDGRGRYFPLIVECALEGVVSFENMERFQSFFDELEETMLATLIEPYAEVDDFHIHFKDFFSNKRQAIEDLSAGVINRSDSWALAVLEATDASIAHSKTPLSIWQANIEPSAPPLMRLIDGWPSACEFVELQQLATAEISIGDDVVTEENTVREGGAD